MEAWEIIQNCKLPAGEYGKERFISAISELPPAQFNLFCNTILHLQHFYSSNLNTWVTDREILAGLLFTKLM